jgi:hypothetical protein
MKFSIGKLLDRILSHHRDRLSNPNKAATSALDQSSRIFQYEALETKPDTKRLSLYLSASTDRLALVQGKTPILVEPGTATGLAPDQAVYAALYDTSPDTEDLSSSPLLVNPSKAEALQDVVVSVSPLGEHSPADEANLSIIKPEAKLSLDLASPSGTPRSGLAENVELFPELKCEIVRGGILGINGRYGGVNRRVSHSSGPSVPTSFTVALERPFDPFQGEEQEKEDEEPHELDHCSRYPLCKICQTVIRKYPRREWYATVLSTKRSLQRRAFEGCPLCMLYYELMMSYSNETTVIASPTTTSKDSWNSDVEGTSDIPPQTTGQKIEELIYKRDTGSKLVLHFLTKKYTIVLDWKYSAMEWSGPGNSFSDVETAIY